MAKDEHDMYTATWTPKLNPNGKQCYIYEFIQTCWFQMKHEHLQCCDEQRLNYTIIRCSLLTPTKRLKVCGIDLDPLCAFDE